MFFLIIRTEEQKDKRKTEYQINDLWIIRTKEHKIRDKFLIIAGVREMACYNRNSSMLLGVTT